MAIKVTTPKTPQQDDKPFPRLMTYKDGSGGVFLFYDEKNCTCIQKSDNDWWKVGQSGFVGSAYGFIDYNEPITIQNA